MKHIILEGKTTEARVLNVAELATKLNQLADTRHKQGKVYPLGMVLTLIILAKLSGEDKPSGIYQWIRLRTALLVKLFKFKHNRMPCLNVIRTIMQQVVSVTELEKVFSHYLYENYGGQTSQLVTIDGKTMRGTIPKGQKQGVHLLAAYLPEEGIVLKQMEVGEKENEITVASELIQSLDLKNKVVCADAMQTQRQLSIDIKARGGDYIWFVKENQPTLLADVQQFFVPPQKSAGWSLPQLPQTIAIQTSSGHGRLEKRTLTLMTDTEQFLDWPSVEHVFKLERQVTHLQTNKVSTQVVYGVCSCTTSATQLLTWTRQYWGIENGLHYRRDFTLNEDATRISCPSLARVMATINNFVVGLSQKLGFSNLSFARRSFNALIALQLLSA